MKRADCDDILKAALVNVATGMLTNATTLPAGLAQDKRLEDDLDLLWVLEASWQRAVAKKFKE